LWKDTDRNPIEVKSVLNESAKASARIKSSSKRRKAEQRTLNRKESSSKYQVNKNATNRNSHLENVRKLSALSKDEGRDQMYSDSTFQSKRDSIQKCEKGRVKHGKGYNAAVIIQSAHRGFLARRQYYKKINEKDEQFKLVDEQVELKSRQQQSKSKALNQLNSIGGTVVDERPVEIEKKSTVMNESRISANPIVLQSHPNLANTMLAKDCSHN